MQPWAEVQAELADALLDPAHPLPRCMPDTADRFAVYRNNVVVGLLDTLQDRFTVTCAIVGEEFFRAMARLFVRQHPPGSAMMMFYGDELPEFIASFEPARSVPYLADIARLEAAWSYSYHAADAESLDVAALGVMSAAALASSTLRLHPSMRLLRSSYPIATIWTAHQNDAAPNADLRSAEDVLIVRPAAEVAMHRLLRGGFVFIDALARRCSIEQAAAAALIENLHFDAGAELISLFSVGAVTAIDGTVPQAKS